MIIVVVMVELPVKVEVELCQQEVLMVKEVVVENDGFNDSWCWGGAYSGTS